MVKYSLPRKVEGRELIGVLEESARFFDYHVDTVPLRETNCYLATLWWRLNGSSGAIQGNFLYDGRPAELAKPNIKSVRIYDEQEIPRSRIGAAFLNTRSVLWTAEAILDEDDTYEFLPVEMYKGEGLVKSLGARFIHLARAKPVRANNGMIVVKPAVDGVAGKVKELLLK
jgi:hypothetical protein